MILSYASQPATQTAPPSISDWLSELQKNAKTEAQLQMEMLKGVSETLKEIQEIREEAVAEEAGKTKGETTGEEPTENTTTKTASSDDIKAPSEVTKADLVSPIDIKL